MQSQVVCRGAGTATSVRCSICNTVTAVQRAGTDMAHMIFGGGCSTSLGSTNVRCYCSHMEIEMAKKTNAVGQKRPGITIQEAASQRQRMMLQHTLETTSAHVSAPVHIERSSSIDERNRKSWLEYVKSAMTIPAGACTPEMHNKIEQIPTKDMTSSSMSLSGQMLNYLVVEKVMDSQTKLNDLKLKVTCQQVELDAERALKNTAVAELGEVQQKYLILQADLGAARAKLEVGQKSRMELEKQLETVRVELGDTQAWAKYEMVNGLLEEEEEDAKQAEHQKELGGLADDASLK